MSKGQRNPLKEACFGQIWESLATKKVMIIIDYYTLLGPYECRLNSPYIRPH
jgi:hypothetical protein